MGSRITPEEAKELLATIKIPPCPSIIEEAYFELQKESPDLRALAEIASKDVCLSALLLRTINSAYFGLKVKVKTIKHAISLLGISNTVNILTGIALRRTMEESAGANPPNFWDSPVNIALCSAYIADQLSEIPPDEAYLAGLFLNAGQALLVNSFPNYVSLVKEACKDQTSDICDIEESYFTVNHTTIGADLAESWGIQQAICDTIRHHHSTISFLPTNDPKLIKRQNLLAITMLAEHIDSAFWKCGAETTWEELKPAVIDQLGLNEESYETLKVELLEMLLYGNY